MIDKNSNALIKICDAVYSNTNRKMNGIALKQQLK